MNKNRKHRKVTNKRRLIAGVATATALSAAMAITAIAAPMDGGQGFNAQGQQPQFSQEMQAPEGSGQFGENAPQFEMNQDGAGQFGGQEMQTPDGAGQFGGQEMQAPDGAGQFGGQEMQAPDGAAPQMENGQMPSGPGMGGRGPQMYAFDQFVKQGIISQETFEAIHTFMQEHGPELPEMNGERPEGMPEFNGERPEGMPEFDGERPEDAPDLLGDLLAEGIITQEEYDAISEAAPQRGPAPMGKFGGPKPAGEFRGPAPEAEQQNRIVIRTRKRVRFI